jgi:hypothetical protein
MKSQISFIALVLVAATAVLGFATVGPLRATPLTLRSLPCRSPSQTPTAQHPGSFAIMASQESKAASTVAGSASLSTNSP